MKYEDYKDSGVAWIGEIPSHWEMVKLKYNFTIYAGATPKTEISDLWNGDIIWITPADYKTTDKYIMCGERTITKKGYDSCNTQIVPRDSLIFSKRAPIGTVAISGIELCTNQGCLSCVPKGVSTTFFYYATSVYSEIFDLLGSGATFKEISASDFSNVKLATPPLDEQQAIVNYLDEKCGKINNAIDVQKKKIDLLNELKQTIITNAVTKGLNPNAPMKDSGVEWIGQVPEHWEVKRLKFNSKFINGFAFKSDSFSDDGEYPVIRIGDIYNDGISYDNIVYVPLNSELDNYKVRNNDILIAMSGATVGKVGLCNSNDGGYINQRVGIVRSEIYKLIWYNLLSPKFLEYIYLMSDGSAQPNISSKGIRDYYIAIPSHEEQQEIIEYLTKEVSKIDAQISKANRRIELLNELKQSVITEAVTGKIKVC